jgi:hypothetical protein
MQTPGQKVLFVQAFDRAGNVTIASAEFIIEAIETPVIRDYPSELSSGDILYLRGESCPNCTVSVFVKKDDGEPITQTVASDGKNEFNFIYGTRVSDGIYEVSVQATDNRGAQSAVSQPVIIAVQKPAMLQIGTEIVNFLAIVVPLIALFIILAFLLWSAWTRIKDMRKRIRAETIQTESAVRKAFEVLKEDIRHEVMILEQARSSRELSQDEEQVIDRLKQHLIDAERTIGKKIQIIKREVTR